ncbi:FkbM family methyltransferase [Allomesorhizobium camelthorni]|uniref:FkbM family methyltransferase n=1 Tax=Allomesorhizobium camelthorni TaxID=475069 RepID=A0A6G4WD27_9HYPH|nr:FkbM family methyltransferase [Mesorhizobium camelthorni]NGO52238.1 FkbM family methyltransferase [Mesorhizobium camelthorni]
MDESELWQTVRRLGEKSEGRTIVDVGAYLGATSAWFLRNFPRAHVYPFEPDPRSYDRLRGNVEGVARAHPSDVALSSAKGEAVFNLGTQGFISSLYSREEERRRYYRRDFTMVDRVPVKTDTLDNLFHEMTIDVLKLDTQGAELDILRGGEGLLKRGAVSIIVTEFFFIQHYAGVPLLDSVWSYLRQFGYEIYNLFKGSQAANGQIRYGDAIFVSPGFRHTVIDAVPDEE